MSSITYQVRRATIDDLPLLLELWQRANIPIAGLEKRLTEFQLLINEKNELLGGMGLQIIGRQGRLHSEAFVDFALADIVREQVWHRMQSLATAQGLARIWQEESVPFWRQNGFQEARFAELAKLPAEWASLSKKWMTLRLRDEEALQKTLEADFGDFKEAQQRAMKDVMQRTKFWKNIAVTALLSVAAMALAFSVYLLINNIHRYRR